MSSENQGATTEDEEACISETSSQIPTPFAEYFSITPPRRQDRRNVQPKSLQAPAPPWREHSEEYDHYPMPPMPRNARDLLPKVDRQLAPPVRKQFEYAKKREKEKLRLPMNAKMDPAAKARWDAYQEYHSRPRVLVQQPVSAPCEEEPKDSTRSGWLEIIGGLFGDRRDLYT